MVLFLFVGKKNTKEESVSEIVSMAFDVLCATVVFQITTLPDYRPKIRMGMHTGPAMGVVAGSNIPKYWHVLEIVATFFNGFPF